jgi:hypothetical protein
LYSALLPKFVRKALKEYKEVIKTDGRQVDSVQFFGAASIRIFCLGGQGSLIEIIDWPRTFSRYRITHAVTVAFKLRRLFATAHASQRSDWDREFSVRRLDAWLYIAKEVDRPS